MLEKDLKKLGKTELQKKCDENKIHYTKKDTKKDLLLKILDLNKGLFFEKKEENKYFIQIGLINLRYFLSKGYFYPIKLDENIENLGKDLFLNFLEFVPIVTKEIKNFDNNIFIEIDFSEKCLKKLEKKGEGTYIYNGIIPLTKIKNIFIKTKEIYENLIFSNFSNLYLPKKVIFLKDLKLEEISLKENFYNLENFDLLHLKSDLNEKNKVLGGQQMLKIFLEEDYYDNFIFKKEKKELKILYNYIKLEKEIDYNSFILLFIKEKIKNKEKFLLKNFYESSVSFIKENIKDEEEIKNLRLVFGNFLKLLEKNITTKDFLDFLDEHKYFGLKIFIILEKFGEIEDLKNFLENGLINLKFIEIKILLSYIFGEKVGYSSLYTELNLNEKINFKFDIFDDYEKDIYNFEIDGKWLKNKCEFKINDNKYFMVKKVFYKNSEKPLFTEEWFEENKEKVEKIVGISNLNIKVSKLQEEKENLKNTKDNEILKLQEEKENLKNTKDNEILKLQEEKENLKNTKNNEILKLQEKINNIKQILGN